MSWSKLKDRFESLFAESLKNRLRVHVTAYTRKSPFDVGRGWFTLDGHELVSVQIPSYHCNNFQFRIETLNFGAAVYEYLSMPIDQARSSSDELIAAFAYLDRRLGKRSLRVVDRSRLHPFARLLFETRCEAEGIALED